MQNAKEPVTLKNFVLCLKILRWIWQYLLTKYFIHELVKLVKSKVNFWLCWVRAINSGASGKNSKSVVIGMTGKTLLKHFIKLLFLWGFLHFHWNEQVSMHDLFCNELWWIFLSTLKWAASSVNPKTPPTHTYGDKPSDAQARQDNGPVGQSYIYIYMYICTYINIFFACQ